jgi:hypothetical protein
MAQPDHVPLREADRVRPVERLPAPAAWVPDRPADLKGAGQPSGRLLGTQGPDQGYALTLAGRFADRLVLTPGERTEDALFGTLGVALKRAALFGRAPVAFDCELALGLFGFLGDAPADLLEWRRPLFQAAAHDYLAQRRISDLVPEATLRLSPAEVRARLSSWLSLVLAARDLGPGEVPVDPRLAGQAEHPLSQDVAHDL